MKKKFWLVPFMLIMMLVMAACNGDDDLGEEEVEADDVEEEGGQGGDLTIGLINEPVTMDPHGSNDIPSAQLRTQLFDTLVSQDTEMEIGEGLATAWEQVDDNTWRFELKEDVTFHNGSDFTAEDVKATLDRLLDPSVGASVAFMFEMVEEVEVAGDHEVLLHTEYPFAPLLSNLAHNTAGILSKEVIDEDYQNALDSADSDVSLEEYYELREEGGDDFEEVSESISGDLGQVIAENPDGTNHLQLSERNPGDNVVLERFEDFHGEARNFDTVTYRVIPENQSRLAELETSGIAINDNVDAENMPRVRDHEDTDIIDQDGLAMTYLAFNYEKEPFDDENVRKAISHAIDRDSIINDMLDGRGILASTHIAPPVFAHDDSQDEMEYDLDTAREYMEQSDHPDGFDATIWMSDSEVNRDIALFMQDTLSEIDINLEIEQYEFGTFLDMANQGDHDMFMLQWITVTGDADYGLYPMFHTDSQDGSGNRWNYSNTELDELLEAGRQAGDEGEREEAYAEAQEILVEDLPIAPLYYGELGIGVNDTLVEGVELDPVGIIRLENVSFPE
ncbi:ABC transporter substrate-binding protein [Lacicoccus alkaliphilus]|uniref:Peptide/nickel transport system substrate-binding protein n=1 Tax=Lacicoccus alkaliphilus DSM 16010 TaxID=1123231 RepID=A0A1M7H921_9BACL|nr:ABC transporter substrate-binding protein [Salinicoccus alkaliphilus]SHM25044.1 peptide/nickel transport system substrate-binding protein [Salinicoccus alkaliphilus DSM 16010]